MEKRRKKNSIYSKDFIFNVLFDYYSSEVSKSFIIRKYGISHGNLYGWLKKYDLEGKELSLSHEIINKVQIMCKDKDLELNKTREDQLEDQLSNLRKALEYSELRNEGLMELLKIGKEEFGIDLLKKDGAKQ